MEIDIDIIQDVEYLLKNLNGYELLSYAICAEECSEELYEWLSSRFEGIIVDEFKYLAKEKRKHAEKIRELFKKLYPNMEPLKINAPPLDTLPLCEKMMESKDIEDALALALTSEILGRDIYRKLSSMTSEKEVAEIFRELGDIKEDMYERLLKVYNRIIENE
ncbi:hypothetical protein DRN43_03775 [Thermococci archaeon]|nr:MAG: hypothetical protein DRN43_03775 [Thermococci archaeon]